MHSSYLLVLTTTGPEKPHNSHSSTMVATSDALVAVADSILSSISDIEKLEYNKKGRKYRFVNNNFQRIREEDKHLIINPDNLDEKLLITSSYCILQNIGDGSIFDDFRNLCLSIVGVARELELNRWYEEGSSVTTPNYAKYDPLSFREAALDFYKEVTPEHISQGLNLLIIAKLNFLHTDHHIGTKLEGYYMSDFIRLYYGDEAIDSPDILVALKSFVHWGNVKGFLYKLDIPNINTTEQLRNDFAKFPEPLEEFKLHVYDRYPSGTSKYSLIRKSIDCLADSPFSKLVPYPPALDQNTPASNYDLEWLYQLCHDIESNPIKYHLRSAVKNLSADPPVDHQELNAKYKTSISSILSFISIYMNLFENLAGTFLMQHSKIPKYNDALISRYLVLHSQLKKISEKVKEYQAKDWSEEDIVIRLENTKLGPTLFDTVMDMRNLFSDDYE